jgi:transposase
MTPPCIDQLPDDPAVLKQMVIEHQMALIGRQLQIERIERKAAAAVAAAAERDARTAVCDVRIEVDQLPGDPAVLKQMVIDREMALIGRQFQIERIEREAAAAVAAVAQRDAAIEQIKREAAEQIEAQRQRHKAEVDALLRRFYGPHNERFDPAQLLLFGRLVDTMPLDIKAVEQEAGQKLVTRRARNRHNHGRGVLPAHLPREIVNFDLKDAEKFDANGKPLKFIGYEISEQLEFMPGGLFVLQHRRFKYAPADYQESDTGAKIVIADKPPQPIEKGLAGPGLMAHVITSKLADHLPLYRERRILARQGVHVAESTMCGWIMAAAELVAPLVLLMQQRIKQSKSIRTDETRVPVQAGSKGKCRAGRIWDWIGDERNPYIVFEYTPDRTGTWPAAWLKGFSGHLQADAGSSYNPALSLTIIRVGCWAHGRRRFVNAREIDPLRSAQMLEMIQQLYKVEDEAANAVAAMPDATQDQADEVRRELRQRKSVPVLGKIKAWLDEQVKLVLPRSPMAEAINYALNQWDTLCVYTEHGFLHIDNNAAERALKLIALGRRNWLFVQNDKFGKAYARLYSLIASVQRHGLDPQEYLRHVLAQIMTTPMSELDRFLPDVYKARLQAEKAAAKATSPGAAPLANASPPVTSPAALPGPGP